MDIVVEETSPQDVRTQVLIAGLFEGEKPVENGLARLDATLGNRIERAIAAGDFTGRKFQLLELYGGREHGPRHILIVGLGNRKRYSGERVRRAFGVAGKRARNQRWNEVTVLPPQKELPGDDPIAAAIAAMEGTALAMYRYVRRSRDLKCHPVIERLHVVAGVETALDGLRAAAERAFATIDGACFARDLVTMPAGDLIPERYAEIARKLASDRIEVEVIDEKKLRELKMGALLAVGQGSAHPPVLIHLAYYPGDLPERAKTFAIAGKGVTFDSGGLNIKSTAGIRDMKIDMAGSATVMGVFKALERIRPKCRVHGFIPAVENMTDGASFRPGDIVTAYNGLTIEIDNTDAEGRLALADALAYAVETFKPDAIVDLATLTGACVTALGHWCSGLMSNDDALSGVLFEAGEATGERVWRLPLWHDYREQIKSEIADLKNTGGRPAGPITAGKFLEEFVGDTAWAHFDIAGTASEGPFSYTPHKELGTGVGVRLLLEALQRWA